jgi:hypothetical protein
VFAFLLVHQVAAVDVFVSVQGMLKLQAVAWFLPEMLVLLQGAALN